jgi:hypothetical protein
MGVRIVKCEHRLEVRSGRGKAADPHQVSTAGVVTHYEPCGIAPSMAQMQQVLGERLRPIQFAAMCVIAGLPAGNLNELHGGTELFPQRPRASVGLARLRRGRAFNDIQHRAQSAGKLELLLPTLEGVGQQRQLVQPLLKLRSPFRHRRAADRPMTGPAPKSDSPFDQTRFGVMLREKLGLAFYNLGGMGLERVSDLRMQLLPGLAQQAGVRRVLHQRVLEAVDRVGRRAALEDQLGSD